MTEIPFITQLGDALERATAADAPVQMGRRSRRWRRQWPLAAVAVALVGGGVATAALVDPSPNTTLVAHGLSCISGTNNSAPSDAYNVPQNGESPTVACGPVIGVPASKLVACASHSTGVLVYESDGSADQCESLHLRPLPAGYTAANASVNRLEQALGRIYMSSDCITPSVLVERAGRALVRLGFTGWRAELAPTRLRGSGACGAYPASGDSTSDPASALNASDHIVMIVDAPPRSVLRTAVRAQTRLFMVSGRRCYSLPAIQRQARDTIDRIAGRSMQILFASTQAPHGATAMQGRQQMYDRGCAIVASVNTTADSTRLEVQLEDRASPPPSRGGMLPTNG